MLCSSHEVAKTRVKGVSNLRCRLALAHRTIHLGGIDHIARCNGTIMPLTTGLADTVVAMSTKWMELADVHLLIAEAAWLNMLAMIHLITNVGEKRGDLMGIAASNKHLCKCRFSRIQWWCILWDSMDIIHPLEKRRAPKLERCILCETHDWHHLRMLSQDCLQCHRDLSNCLCRITLTHRANPCVCSYSICRGSGSSSGSSSGDRWWPGKQSAWCSESVSASTTCSVLCGQSIPASVALRS